jgi:hypothetical protein
MGLADVGARGVNLLDPEELRRLRPAEARADRSRLDDAEYGDCHGHTQKLWLKCARDGKVVDRKLWFSDTYIRTAKGWRYAFGQSSLSLPPAQ